MWHTLGAVFLSESEFLSRRGKERLGGIHFLDASLLFWKRRRCLSEGSLLFPPSLIPSVSTSVSAGRYTHVPNKQGHLQTLWMYEISLLSGNLVFFSFLFFCSRVFEIHNTIWNTFCGHLPELSRSRWPRRAFLLSGTRLFRGIVFPQTQFQCSKHYKEAWERSHCYRLTLLLP